MHSILRAKLNNGFDYDGGFYKIVIGDHIAYRYEVLQELGKGAFGQVVKCYDHKDKCEVAIKITRNSAYDHTNSRAEVALLKKLSTSHNSESRIVKLKDSLFFRNHYCIVFELLGSNLYNDIKETNFQGMPIDKVKNIIKQIVEGLNVLKSHEVVHCDLKPENILYTDSKRENIKLIDFGSSCTSSE